MALKPKTPIFKSINGEMDLGGAPIYADDLVRIQENNRGDVLNYFEALRRLLPPLLYYTGPVTPPVQNFENGLILSGLEYDNTDPANPIVSEGYILSGGEVCYYPGGTISTGLISSGLLHLYKGAPTYTARTFSVGGSKDILVTHSVVIEQGEVLTTGPVMPVGSAITATDEVVALQIGTSSGIGEKYFSNRAALGIIGIGESLNKNPWISANLEPTITVDSKLGFIVSRVNADGSTEIRGSIGVPAGSLSGDYVDVLTLNRDNVQAANSIVISVETQELDNPVTRARVWAGGLVRILKPVGGWGVADITIIFNTVFLGNPTLTTPYTYDVDFLNIT